VSPKKSKLCHPDGELQPLFDAISQRYSQLTDENCQRRVFLNRLRTMALFGAEPMDYAEPEYAELPKEMEIGFAVCHPACGNQAFVVVEGGPQGCDCCGGTMLPVKTGTYRLKRKTG
jgi:hypothetical protein